MERKSVEQETEKEEKTITKTITVKEKPARRDLNLEGLPVTEHHIYLEGTTDENGALKSDYVEIGTEESSRLELTPAKLCVAKTIRHKVILKSELEDKQPEERKIMIAPMPLMPVSKSMAGASVLADIIIGKFMYHLPFYRQIRQYKEHGVSISAYIPAIVYLLIGTCRPRGLTRESEWWMCFASCLDQKPRLIVLY